MNFSLPFSYTCVFNSHIHGHKFQWYWTTTKVMCGSTRLWGKEHFPFLCLCSRRFLYVLKVVPFKMNLLRNDRKFYVHFELLMQDAITRYSATCANWVCMSFLFLVTMSIMLPQKLKDRVQNPIFAHVHFRNFES